VNFSRLLVVTGALAATVSVADEAVAQSFANDPAIAVQEAWTSGYMGLGGGLIAAMPLKAKPSKAAAVRERRVAHKPVRRAERRAYDPGAPTVLIATTLDHTGENIATLGGRTSP
jgi:hypothetical protein